MQAYLKQRGWKLPAGSDVIPNVVPNSVKPADGGVAKPVWRLCFFGRLEERKGIKVFVEALSLLEHNKDARFEVIVPNPGAGIGGLRLVLRLELAWLMQH